MNIETMLNVLFELLELYKNKQWQSYSTLLQKFQSLTAPYKTEIIDALWELARDPSFILPVFGLALLEDSPRKEWCERFFEALLTGHCPRPQLQTPDSTPDSRLRVTFITRRGNMRAIRIALTAKAAGMAVQLIVQKDTEQQNALVQTYADKLDQVVWIESFPRCLEHTLHAVNSFKSHIVHCHMQLDFNQSALWMLASCPLPIVGDAYDMVNAQYDPTHSNMGWFPAQSLLEKIWYQSVDGICYRSPYRRLMAKRGIISQQGSPYVHMPEPLLSTNCVNQHGAQHKHSKAILIYYWHDSLVAELKEMEQAWSTLGYRTILINSLKKPTNNILPQHIIKNVLEYKKYTMLLKSISIFLMTPTIKHDNLGYMQDSICGHFGNKHVDCIENNIIILIPEYYKYVYNLFKRTNRIIRYTDKEIKTKQFWDNLSKNIEKCREKSIDNYYFEQEQGKRLYKFYQKVLTFTQKRTS